MGLRLITNSTCTAAATASRPAPVLPKAPPRYSHEIHFKICRREAAAAAAAAAVLSQLCFSPPAAAFGISGPKEWLKQQKRNTSKFLLAPIEASRQNLRYVFTSLASKDSNTSEEVEDILKLLRTSARDCMPLERNSFVTFQANSGVEVCTFKLVVKNASSLLDDKDPVKLKAEGMLDDLIRSFTSLNSMASEADIQLASSRQKLADALVDTVSSLDKFEQGVKECLEV